MADRSGDLVNPQQPHWVDGGDTGVTAATAPRHMKFVRVSVDELEDLKSSNSTLELAFFGISLGALITVATTLGTVPLPDSTRAIFVALTVLFGLASAYFGGATIRGELRWRRRINYLKSMADS
jgi:hypothetical protein